MKETQAAFTFWIGVEILSSENFKGQFDNVAAFKIIVVSCAVEIISCEENQLSVW